mgnify:CR=1 FL=1
MVAARVSPSSASGSTAPTATSAIASSCPTAAPAVSSDSAALEAGLGVGLGVPLLVALAFAVLERRKRVRAEGRLAIEAPMGQHGVVVPESDGRRRYELESE